MPKTNAYSEFVNEKYRKMGISRVEAFGALGETWRKMSPAERAPYEAKAGKPKGQIRFPGQILLNDSNRQNITTVGVPYEEVERQKQEKEAYKRNMTNWINSRGPKGTILDKPEKFTVIGMQKHTKTHTGVVVPAEIAIVQFDLVEGVKYARSYIVKNRENWVKKNAPAYQFKMHDKAKHSHAIPVDEKFPLAEDIESIVMDMINTMEVASDTDEILLPPVFTLNLQTETIDHIHENNMEDMEVTLEYLFEESGLRVKPPLVYDITQLFRAMYKALMEKGKVGEVRPTMLLEVLKSRMDNDRFLLEQFGGDCCKFHYEFSKEADFNMENCALATAKRWVYIMCDHLSEGIFDGQKFCPDYGKHKPPLDGEIGICKPHPLESNPFFRKSDSFERCLENAMKMSVRKEYYNHISGIQTGACGSMNGTTLLPTDRDPAVDVARQLKENMEKLKLEDQSNKGDDTKYYSFNEGAERLRQEDFPGLGTNANNSKVTSGIPSIHSVPSKSSEKSRSTKSRLWAKFDEPSANNHTQYKSFD